ncbi:MAG: UDP-N-acetylglucosamine 1-carboxyvinyltransferase [Candidatus Pacebacteria bacterium]|nr:UDP-N-acetylglucosamine 1-carboxyvinyltransferase [Candidatus Paceibacterota bacterium]PIR63787.1 MAG: UDP-N-acetylglucosamine 1-carboxyvinyltransferase [Candidatus Pacebacteria bacterium CG10_big_fil_rev_8_21_14_0_10_40_26]PIZ78573.1 MAG: UDP-N-acetylglucosamine 1-carboxyvinyltransferase [Candidatus Pacebacteria bacterium CG_4_10_14_0_2_um_filter_40_20]PJA69424.1 MAG: UDP-N-acetylglucosamine 1-carboxyvinyltransferase [Candidatus Pacebacteria bacterium CG_4_9_14_3_um_filter_40_12]PJC41441.1 
MPSFKVTGGTPLHGSVRIGGAKNASYKLMIASLLASSESRLLNFSRILDVELVAEIISYLGGKVNRAGERAIFIDPSTLSSYTIDKSHGEQGRFSTMFIPPLLAKFGRAEVPVPGGDKIGKRSLDRHWDGLRALGAEVEYKDGMYIARCKKLVGTTYRFAKNSHTGTETLIMAAALAEGTTILENAAEEPEIDDLITFINSMGGRVRRRANRVIEIRGVERLDGAIHKLLPDRNEAVSYACAAIATKGDVIIENARHEHLTAFLDKLDEIGAGYEVGNYGIRFFYKGPLRAADITTSIEPGFMTDWQPLWATLATQCEGESVIHETIMANRFQYVEELKAMGVKIERYNPEVMNPEKVYNFDLKDDQPEYRHAIKIHGAAQLKAGSFTVKDLRHGATLIMAAMIADGTSTISGIEHVDRGYEALDERLRSMGAQIKRD